MRFVSHSGSSFLGLFQFDVPAKLLAHRAEKSFREGMILARTKPRKERRREHIHRHRGIERGLNGPASFSGILDKAGVLGKSWIFRQRDRRQIEQPRRDYAAAAPYFGDVCDIELITILRRQLL